MTRIALLFVLLCGCSPNQSSALQSAQARVKSELKDPESAQFQNLEEYGSIVCGEVNAKNSYGGYSGFKPFIVHGVQVAIAEDTGDELTTVRSRSQIGIACIAASIAPEQRTEFERNGGTKLEDAFSEVF